MCTGLGLKRAGSESELFSIGKIGKKPFRKARSNLMPGPMPKNPATRQRRNQSSTRAILPAEERPLKRAPRLPQLAGIEWLKLTRRWWAEIWRSPQREEFLRVDLMSLYRLAVLTNQYFNSYELETAREMRLLEREFGFTPLSRRRLEWTVTNTEEAKDQHAVNRAKRAKRLIDLDADPRGALD